MKVGKAGKAGPHAAYIAREGQYANRLERGEKLEATEAGNMPAWAQSNPLALWQAADAYERKNGTTYREMEIALPRELDTGQHIQLVRDLVRENFTAKGMIADCAFHEANASDGGKNPHVHILLTMREIDTDGFGKKNREWNDTEVLESWREEFEKRTNDYLEETGCEGRLSLKSYEDQGSSKTPSAHMGSSAWYMEERGIETDRGNENRQIAQRNAIQETVLNQTPRPRPAEKEKPEEERDAVAAVSYTHLTLPTSDLV